MAERPVESSPMIGDNVTDSLQTVKPLPQQSISETQFLQSRCSDTRQGIVEQWWQELFATALSAISFAAIIVTLLPHDGQPLPQWPYSITINALISIYVVIFKAALLYTTAESLSQLKWLWYKQGNKLLDINIFDQASRGPWGSFKFLWSIAPRNVLAGIGASVTILFVVVDPFTQQLLAYEDCSRPVIAQNASLPRATRLNFGADTVTTIEDIPNVPPSLRMAVLSGLFSDGEMITAECSSGNCTFPETYSTLSLCSLCTDISDEIVFHNKTSTDDYSIPRLQFISSVPSNFIDVINTDGSISANWSATDCYNGDSTVSILRAQTFDFYKKSLGWNWHNQSCALHADDYWPCRGYGAAVCNLSLCVNKYNASVSIGSLSEVLVDSYNGLWGMHTVEDVASGSYHEIQAIVDLECISSEERSMLSAQGYTIDSGQSWLPYNVSYDPHNRTYPNTSFPYSMDLHGCLYSANVDHLEMLNDFYSDFFPSVTSGPWDTDAYYVLDGSLVGQKFWNWGNMSFESVDDTFRNISRSMSTAIRQNTGERVIGLVMRDQTCLHVRWIWLSFPAILALITWIFFGCTVIAQYRSGWVPGWKSSLLPLPLAVSLAGEQFGEDKVDPKKCLNELDETAARVRLRLERTLTSVRLVED